MRLWLTTVAIVVLSTGCAAQSFPPEQTVRPERWDSAHGVLFFGRGVLGRNSLPVRSYLNGSQRGSDIDIFKDFPGLQVAVVIDLAAGPNGTTVLSAVLAFGSKTLRHVILTYDSGGALRSSWDTEPYMAWAIATDEKGDAFSLGDRLLGKSGSKPYPLLREYDHSGDVVRQSLYSNTFHAGPQAIGPGNGLDYIYPSLTFRDGKLYIYAPVENEVLICTVAGGIIRRERLDNVRQRIVEADKVESAGIEHVEFIDDRHIVLDLEEYSSGPITMPRTAYVVDLSTKHYSLIQRSEGAQFIGTRNGKLLMLTPSPDQHPVIKSYSVAKK